MIESGMGETRISAAGRSDLGRVRDDNEDSFLVDAELGAFAVADGLGGHSAGEVASALAVETVRAHVRAWVEGGRKSEPIDVAREAVEAACHAVYDKAAADPKLRGMGSTLVVVVQRGTSIGMAHVGDSRLYLVREGRVDQLSADQTIAAEFARAGIINPSQVESHPYSHVLTQSLGKEPTVIPETLAFTLAEGDVLVLASDGLNPVANDSGQFARIAGEEVEDATAQFIDAANAAGGRDNVSVVVLRCAAAPAGATQSFPALARPAPLFEGLSTAGLWRVRAAGEVRRLAAGDVVLRAGDRADHLVVVLRGELQWSVSGQERTLRTGEALGLSAVLAPRPSPGELVAATDAQILCLDAAELDRLLKRRKRLGGAVVRAIAGALAAGVAASGGDEVSLNAF